MRLVRPMSPVRTVRPARTVSQLAMIVACCRCRRTLALLVIVAIEKKDTGGTFLRLDLWMKQVTNIGRLENFQI